jgi:mannitol/fructose-specific phosphotransferase system IIA component (Ntr-type)
MTTLIGPSVLDPSLYIPDLKTKRKSSVLQELVARAHAAGAVRVPEVLRDTLLLRERLAASGIGKGVAVPHARSIAVVEPRLVIARSRRGVEWEAADEVPIQLVFLVLSPAETGEDGHATFVAHAASVSRLQKNRSRLLEAEEFAAVADVFAEVFA